MLDKKEMNLDNQKVLVIFSGGVDSTVLLHVVKNYYNCEVTALHFTYGSKHNEQELKAVGKICLQAKVDLIHIELPFIEKHFKSSLLKKGAKVPDGHYTSQNMSATVVPFRNGIMASIAAGYAVSHRINYIALGVHSGDHVIYPDCRPEFITLFGTSCWQGTDKTVKLFAPFLELTKQDIVTIGRKMKVPFVLTYTCYKGENVHCGTCGACVERKEAFQLANVKDPTIYKN